MEQANITNDQDLVQAESGTSIHTDVKKSAPLLEGESQPDKETQIDRSARQRASPAISEEPFVDVPNTMDAEADKGTQLFDDESDTRTNSATIGITFFDFGYEPIEGLKYKLVTDGKITVGKTDAAGKAETLSELIPGAQVEIFVFREHSADFKNIGTLHAYPGCTWYSIVSPKLKYDLETEQHSGTPGDADKSKPPVPPKSKESKKETTYSTPVDQSSSALAKPAGAASASSLSITSDKRTHTPHASQASAKSIQKKTKEISHGRNADGHPQATVRDSTVDWLKRKILSVFNFWTWQNFQMHAPQPAENAPLSKPTASKNVSKQVTAKSYAPVPPMEPVQGHLQINPLIPPAVATPGKKLSGADLARLQTLISFVEKQVKLDYSPFKGSGGTTVNVLKEYAKAEEPSFSAKDPNKPLGICQVYVKVALFKANYTNGPGWEGQAKASGKDWLKYGFTDVSNSLPQVEITYEDAIAPGDRPRAESYLKKQAEVRRLQAERKKKKNPMTTEEVIALEREIPEMPEKKEAKYLQPDLMYTLPGDVIVYEQVSPLEIDPAGHVDIRTYHGFMSDFAWRIMPSLGGRAKPNKRYRVIGVYRKVSDTLAMTRVHAFLRIIRELEAKGYKQPYRALRRQNGREVNFESYETHPGSAESKKLVAGAYQIMWSTWDDVVNATGWPHTFTPEMQDRMAIYLMQERPFPKKGAQYPRRTALGYVLEGKVEDAINETNLSTLWSCLPGGGIEQQITMSELRSKFDQYVKESTI